MKDTFKILATNWINLLGIFIITFLYVFLNSYINFSATLYQAFFGAFMSVCLYGIIFWSGFVILILILDLIFIVKPKNNLKLRLMIEWLLISIPFIYWIIKYNQWVFLVAILTFLVTQIMREKKILKIKNNNFL